MSDASPDKLIADLVARGVTRAKIGGFDVDGVLRGKYVSLDKLKSALAGGFGFCDVIFGWDIADVLYDNATVTGWHTGYPDVHAVLDLSTMRDLPWEPNTVAILADFRGEGGAGHRGLPPRDPPPRHRARRRPRLLREVLLRVRVLPLRRDAALAP